jgi:hypothetical protein
MQYLSLAVICIIAVGLPFVLLICLVHKSITYEKDSKEHNLAVAKRISVDLGVPIKDAEFVIRDVTIGRELSFVMDAYVSHNVGLVSSESLLLHDNIKYLIVDKFDC